MKRAITDGILALFVGIVMYIIILSAFYGSDKVLCSKYGYSNKITPTFEGYCTREIAEGVVEVVPVEYMERLKHNPKTGEKGWRNEK